MGKGNRERLKRENDNLVNADAKAKTAKKQKSKGVPLWAGNMILGAIGLLLVVVIVVTTISSSGIVLKLTKYASTHSYELTGTQMTYIFKTLYNNFTAQYSSYISYLIDSSVSLKDQNSIYTGDDDEPLTWFEYFALQTEAEAEQLLVLCELAKSEGMDTLTEDEEQEINDAIQTMSETALSTYGMTLKGFIKSAYGPGVTENDIATVMRYQIIAGNYYEVIEERLGEKIDEDRVNAYFDENKNDFLNVDYLTFSFNAAMTVLGATAESDEKVEAENKYTADKKIVDEYFDKFEAVKTVDEFRAVLVDYLVTVLAPDSFDSVYDEEFDDVKDDLLPSDDDKAAFKTETLAKLKEELLKVVITYEEETEEEDKTEEDTTEEEKEEDKRTEVEKAQDKVWEELLETFTTKMTGCFYEGATYNEENETSKWLYNEDTAENAVKGTAPAEETTDTKKTYTATIAMLVKKPYKDESPTKNVGHILFTKDTHDDPEAKANEILKEFLKGDKTKDSFEKLGLEHTEDSNVFYDNVKEGDMVAEFEEWLFDETRKEGDTGVVETEYGFHVMYFVGTSNAVWYNNVFDTIFAEDYEAWLEEAKVTAGIEINQKNINKIEA